MTSAIKTPNVQTIDLKLEVVVIPVSNADRAKRFYHGLGWRLDADFAVGDTFRVVQFTPPGSPSSIHFGTGLTSAAPGSASGLYLVVSDIEAARVELAKPSQSFRVPRHSTSISFTTSPSTYWRRDQMRKTVGNTKCASRYC